MPNRDVADEEERERAALRKAHKDIEDGEMRLNRQERLLSQLDADGHDTTQAKYLAQTLHAALSEWRNHRVLIEQRIAYLTSKEARQLPQ